LSPEVAASRKNRILLKDQTYQSIKHEILTGVLEEGALLSERFLAEKFSIGKAPVRDAVARLCSEGYLSIVPQRGMLVRGFSVKDMIDTFELRVLIEPSIVAGLSGKLDANTQSSLEEILNQQAIHAEAQAVEEFIVQDLQFHMQLANAYGNREISKVMERNCELVFRSLFTALNGQPDRLQLALNDHRAIYQSLCDSDTSQAVTRITRHIKSTKSLILNLSAEAGH